MDETLLEEKPGLLEAKALTVPAASCPPPQRPRDPAALGLLKGHREQVPVSLSCLLSFFQVLGLADSPFPTELTTHRQVS